jgi:dihydroflavonol-4-reductase
LIEEEFRAEVAKDGFPVVMVNPTGIFGPYELKPVAMCLVPQLARGKIPAYVLRSINIVDAADVAVGHVLAAEKGRIGERYILGGHNIDTKILMSQICEVLGVMPPSLQISMKAALAVAYANEILSLTLRMPPRVPVLGLKFAEYGQALSSDKAIRELGYATHPMRPCFERALKWYREIGYC